MMPARRGILIRRRYAETAVRWGGIFLLALLSGAGVACKGSIALTDDLLGVWKTEEYRYRNTSFELKPGEIIFSNRAGESETFPIIKVSKKQLSENDWDLYTIRYRNDHQQELEFTFYFFPAEVSLIRLKNQINVVWRKAALQVNVLQKPAG